MDELNQVSGAGLPNKRKRYQPHRDESLKQQQVNPPITTTDGNLIGQVVSGVVEGSFEAGYFLNVKVADTENQLKGIVFLPGKVSPVTPTTDLFPQAKMHAREDIPIPSLNQQTPPQGKKDVGNQTDDFASEPQSDSLIADKNQSATCITSPPPHVHPMSDAGVTSVAVHETYLPLDTQMKDVGSSAEEKLTEPKGQTLSLMPQFASDDVLKEDHNVVRYEACGTKLETLQRQATGSISTLSLELFQNETKPSKIEDVKSPTDAKTCEIDHTLDENLASSVDDVPKELQLELGNKSMSASSVATEAKPDQSASSKSGFLTNACEGKEETVKKPEEPITNAAAESGFPEATTQVADNDS